MEQNSVELKIKNEHVQEMLELNARSRSFSKKEEQEYLASTTTQQHGEYLLIAYALDMMLNSVKVDSALDLTYDTLGNLPMAMSSCFRGYVEEGNSQTDSAYASAKSLAAYLTLLGMNEHGCNLKVVQMGTATMPPPESEQPLWGQLLRVKVGIRREVDLLPPVYEGMKFLHGDKGSLLMFVVDPVFLAYKSAFRINLIEHGLKNMALEV